MNGRDFLVSDEGTLVVLTPVSENAEAWVEEWLPEDALTWGPATVIEQRYAGDILSALLEEGFVLQLGGELER